jgi:hypothetical protein
LIAKALVALVMLPFGFGRSLLASCALVLSTLCAHAVTDEIQVYNGDIAKVGQWTLQSHSNYVVPLVEIVGGAKTSD